MPAVQGVDRCDPVLGKPTPDCGQLAQAGAGASAPGAAPVTAEARLLMLTQPPTTLLTADGVSRQLSRPTSQLDTVAGSAASALASALQEGQQQPREAPPPPAVIVLTPR